MKHETKRELIGSLFIAFFLVGLLIPASILNGYSEIDNFTETQPTNLIDPVVNDQQTESVNLETWYLGESVKTDIEFNKISVDWGSSKIYYEYYNIENYDFHRLEYMFNVYTDDSARMSLFWMYNNLPNPPLTQVFQISWWFKIYAGGSGVFYYEHDNQVYDDASNYVTTTTDNGNLNIASNCLDGEGYLHFRYVLDVNINVDTITQQLYYFRALDSSQINLFDRDYTSGVSSLVNIKQVSCRWDILYFKRDTITNYVRSSYQYASATTIIHRLEIPSIRHAKEINVYYPESWSYSSINPYASVTDSSYTLTVNSPTELNYYLLFSSTCTNLLTIKDVSTDYLTNVGFETGEYLNDWYLMAGELSTDISIATNIVSGGYYSLRIDKNATSDYLILRMFNHKYYNTYVSFDIYYDSRTAGDYLQLAYHDYTSWLYESLEFETDRWYKCFFYLDYVKNVEFYSKASNDVFDVYVDNFKIWQTSTTIETLEPDKYKISSTLRSWDGYKNPLLSGQQTLNATLLERSSQTVVYSTNLTSTTGPFELEYFQALEQKEYELWTYSYSSGEFNNCSFYFTPSYTYQTDFAETELNDAWDFSEGDIEGWAIYDNPYYRSVVNGLDMCIQDEEHVFMKQRIALNLNSKVYNQFKIRIYSNYTNPVFGLYSYDNLKTLGTQGFNQNEWTIITFDLSINEDWKDDLGFIIRLTTAIEGDMYKIDYTLLNHEDDPVLYDSYYWFHLTSTANTYQYSCYSDENYQGLFNDLEFIPVNNSIGTHNFTYVLFSDSSNNAFVPVVYELIFYNPESDNYYVDIAYSYDLFGSLNILLLTYWGNQTLDIYDNSTLLVNDILEGDITTLYTVDEGYHNITIEVYNSASLVDSFSFGFYIVIPDPIANYYLDLGYNYDLSGSLNFWIYTYWGNLTVDIFDNSTQLVDGVLEGDITTLYLVTEGYHNITVDLYNGASLWDSLEFGFIISSDIEIYTVHLDLFDQGGLGIPFSKVKCYMDSINDTNRLPQDFLTLDQNFTLYVTDYFNVTLTYFDVTLNYTLTTNYVDVEILFYEAQFTNRYNFAVTLEIVRNSHSHSFTLIANQTIAFWITSGQYNITCSPLTNIGYDSYTESWTTTSEIKHYRVYLDQKPTTTKKPINVVAFVIFIVQAGAIAGGLTFAYMNIFKPLKKEFIGFSIKNAFKHKKGQTWTTIIIAIIAIAMGGLYTLGG